MLSAGEKNAAEERNGECWGAQLEFKPWGIPQLGDKDKEETQKEWLVK